ncbi:hypothetical protein DMP06_05205 [Slackia equolifaciens]|uniref:Uncharacterized protein n=1 Tax=Slackia equolifaciens TaxID=498718 RepID=A0A3N0B0I2_9ACTN|nr:hypothetical protein [Slackia equolifaciens]RNL40334.1 hypothetical protein DMP06_05205 [Slackia equolifaciens]
MLQKPPFVCETTFVQQQIGVRLRNALDAAAEWRLCCCETPLMLLRIDVNAAEERRWCWCGSTFMLMRSDVYAAAGGIDALLLRAWRLVGATACCPPLRVRHRQRVECDRRHCLRLARHPAPLWRGFHLCASSKS